MPTIRIADQAGACYGVERALDLVEKASAEAAGSVYTLGPLIHNPQVVSRLESKVVHVADDIDLEPGSTLVIRSHGVVPEVISNAKAAGLNVVDATCPFVMKAHASAARLERDGYQVLIVGEKGHPEVEGILGHARSAKVVGDAFELDRIELGRRVGVVVQTTQSVARLREVLDVLVSRVEEVCVINTICSATTERQASAAELSSSSDVMVVIGGRNSANTTRLAEICSERCERTHHIETPEELSAEWFSDAERIGVTAGASTPAAQIDAVVEAIRSMSER